MTFDQIDKTYLINLDEMPGRLITSDEHLKEHGIKYERFSAIKHERGLIGLLMTMDQVFKKCIEKEYQHVLILEDDCQFVAPTVPFLNEVLPQLPKDYLCLYLGCNLLMRPVRHSANILRIKSAYATHAILYSLEAMKIILPLIGQMPTLAYDIILMQHLNSLGRCYCTFPQLCLQRPGFSSIEGGFKDWGAIATFTYNSHTFNL